MVWKEEILAINYKAEFFPGASSTEIQQAEAELGIGLPEDLTRLLQESNGIEGEYGLALIWPLERIVRENKAFRENPDFLELYMPFDHLLFFADAGNGDQFAWPIQAGEIRRPDVFVWNHEDDSRTWFAASLKEYLVHGLTRKLQLSSSSIFWFHTSNLLC